MKKVKKYYKNKQEAYFKEYGIYATDDTVISEWMEEYHNNCVMENTLNDAVLGTANEEDMLRKLWLDIVNKKVRNATTSYDVTSFANNIIQSYRMTFIDYIPPEPYIPPQHVAPMAMRDNDAVAMRTDGSVNDYHWVNTEQNDDGEEDFDSSVRGVLRDVYDITGPLTRIDDNNFYCRDNETNYRWDGDTWLIV